MKKLLQYDDVKVFKYDNLLLAVIYTIGHIFIAMTCNRIITGASLDVAAADALIEPMINGVWFYLLFEVFNKYKTNLQNNKTINTNKSPSPGAINQSKLAPINNKKNLD